MNMAIRGIDADFGAYQADTFFNDLHKTLKADFIMANPPSIFPTGDRKSSKKMFVGNTEHRLPAMPTMRGFSI